MNRLSRSTLLITLLLMLVLAGCGGGAPEAEDAGTTGGAEQAADDALVLTQDMVDSEVEMKLGSEAVVQFDPTYDWRIITTPSLVLDDIPDAVLAEGQQVRLVAKLNGTAVIQATGRALCKQDNPPCDTPNKQVNIKVKVSP